MMSIRQIELREANSFIEMNHKHHGKVQGHRFSIGCFVNDELVGVAVCGRPISRNFNQSVVIEITRLCTDGMKKNAASKLLGTCSRIAREFGYKKIITYTLKNEGGISLKAAGYNIDSVCEGNTYDKSKNRGRVNVDMTLFGEKQKYPNGQKLRWYKEL